MESFIHIGMPKSASTYLQKNYFNKLDDVYFIQKAKSTFINEKVQDIYNDFTKNHQLEFLKFCKDNKIDKVIYSQETISKMYKNKGKDVIFHLQILKKIFINIKIIYIVRKQDDFILSAYKNSVMNGNNLSLKKFMNFNESYTHVYHNRMLFLNWKEINIYNRVKELYEIFGENNVLVLPVELLREDKKLFFTKLNEFIDTDYNSNISNSATNVSFSDFQIKIISFFNKFTNNGVNSISLIINNPFRTLFGVNVKFDKYIHINYFIKLCIFKFKSYRLMGDELKNEIISYYSNSNKKLSNLIKIDLSKFGYYT